MPLRGAADGDAIASGAQAWLAGVWLTGQGLDDGALIETFRRGAAGAAVSQTVVIFPVTEAILSASEVLCGESAGGVLPDPAPESVHTGTGFWPTSPNVLVMIAGCVATPSGSTVVSIDASGGRRLRGRTR